MTVKTYTQIIAEINASFPSGIPGFITALGARTAYIDMMDSTFLSTVGQGAYNVSDAGYDIVVGVGDSTLYNSQSIVLTRDVTNPNRIFQWNQASFAGFPANTVNPANDPLAYPTQQQAGLSGPVVAFCRRLLLDRPPNRSILIIPQAVTGSGLSNTFTEAGALGQNQGWAPPNKTAQTDILCTGAGALGDTVTINGVTMTSIAGVNAGLNFQFSAVAQTYAQNLRDCINTNKAAIGVATPSAVTNALFTVQAAASGSAGNYQCDQTKTGPTFYSFYFNALDINNGFSTAAVGARFTGGSDAGGGTFYAAAISQANLALAGAGSTPANNRVLCILSDIGSNDRRMSTSQWQTWYLGMIDGLRAGITGAANCPFVEIGMVPEYAFNLAGGAGDFLKAKYVTQSAISTLRAYTAFAVPSYGNQNSPLIHPDAITSIWNGGTSAYQAYLRASTWEVAQVVNNTLVTTGPTNAGAVNQYVVTPTDTSLRFTQAGGCIVTLPDPTVSSGRWLTLKTETNDLITSNASNVRTLDGSATGTGILTNTSGKWADLQADSSAALWRIMRAN